MCTAGHQTGCHLFCQKNGKYGCSHPTRPSQFLNPATDADAPHLHRHHFHAFSHHHGEPGEPQHIAKNVLRRCPCSLDVRTPNQVSASFNWQTNEANPSIHGKLLGLWAWLVLWASCP